MAGVGVMTVILLPLCGKKGNCSAGGEQGDGDVHAQRGPGLSGISRRSWGRSVPDFLVPGTRS